MPHGPCRQTQNPERGRKREEPSHLGLPPAGRQTQNPERGSSDPKPREGTKTFARVPVSVVNRQSSDPKPREGGSSDPKPREGTKTRNPAPHPQLRHAPEVVRPKTPRGDENRMDPGELQMVREVVRPKTPRGDENTETQHQPDNLILASSDPKPREGTKTPRGWRMRCARKCRQTQNPERGGRQTQNPERGRKHSESHVLTADSHVVRPKTPRGDENAYRPPHHSHATAPCPQTQNPERGRKLASAVLPVIAF
ncbi:Uncharacterised protein [Mycobacterium tuberculosis]|nr:Uncharacterised protein [Mycobacterium tuberculosis]